MMLDLKSLRIDNMHPTTSKAKKQSNLNGKTLYFAYYVLNRVPLKIKKTKQNHTHTHTHTMKFEKIEPFRIFKVVRVSIQNKCYNK